MEKVTQYLTARLKERSTRLVIASAISALVGGAVPVEILAQGLNLFSIGLVAMVGVTKDKTK